MKTTVHFAEVLLGAVLVLVAAAAPRLAWAQQGSEHDAGDEEMLTGQPAQPRVARPGGRSAAPEAPPAELSYTTRLDKTAVWVGDLFHYAIIVDHSPNIQFVLENLNKETINMEPLRVVDATSNSTPLKNGNTRLIVDLTLVTFTVGEPEQQLPQITLFYFRKDAGSVGVEEAAAESLTVQGPKIGLRSTLPPEAADLRDAVTVTAWAPSRWVVAGIGWVALIALIAGVGWETATLVRYRKGRKGPDPRKAMAAIRERWSSAVPSDFSSPEAVLEFYGRSYHDLKEYLGYAMEAPTEGMTAEDLQANMGRLAANPDLTERAIKVLTTCETARYGRNGKELTGDSANAVAHDMRQIFEAGARM